MPINLEHVLAQPPRHVRHSYSQSDVRLYALATGFGANPLDRNELLFVNPGKRLRVSPTFLAVATGDAGGSFEDVTLDHPEQMVHYEQKLTLHKPLPASGTLVMQGRIPAIYDRGKDRGALIPIVIDGHLEGDSDPLFSMSYITLARGDGGFGGPAPEAMAPSQKSPERAPDLVVDMPTLPQQALLYSLTGDVFGIHIDPDFATKVGFEKPILHGLCTYGMAAKAMIAEFCDWDPSRLRQFDVRFTSPFLPGDTLRVEAWRENGELVFRALCVETGNVVLSNGRCVISEG